MTLFARTIEAILNEEVFSLRQRFHDLVVAGPLVDYKTCLVATELCRCLLNDVAVMPTDLCAILDVVPGTTYARAAEATVRRLLFEMLRCVEPIDAAV